MTPLRCLDIDRGATLVGDHADDLAGLVGDEVLRGRAGDDLDALGLGLVDHVPVDDRAGERVLLIGRALGSVLDGGSHGRAVGLLFRTGVIQPLGGEGNAQATQPLEVLGHLVGDRLDECLVGLSLGACHQIVEVLLRRILDASFLLQRRAATTGHDAAVHGARAAQDVELLKNDDLKASLGGRDGTGDATARANDDEIGLHVPRDVGAGGAFLCECVACHREGGGAEGASRSAGDEVAARASGAHDRSPFSLWIAGGLRCFRRSASACVQRQLKRTIARSGWYEAYDFASMRGAVWRAWVRWDARMKPMRPTGTSSRIIRHSFVRQGPLPCR